MVCGRQLPGKRSTEACISKTFTVPGTRDLTTKADLPGGGCALPGLQKNKPPILQSPLDHHHQKPLHRPRAFKTPPAERDIGIKLRRAQRVIGDIRR